MQAMARTRAVNGNFKPNDDYEKMQFFYHPDHLGSSSYITNLDGEVSQHIEYVLFGEVFIEERNNTWNTPYLFNAKEFDEETGMYYYGARYYDPRLSLWMSCDPKQEKYYNNTTYCYTVNNPIIFIDPNGKDWIKHNHTYFYNPLIKSKEDVEQYYGKGYEYLFPSGTLYATDHSYSYDLAIGGHVQNSYTKEFILGTTETAYGSTIINSNQYISQYEPSFMEKWAKSDNFFASLAYGTLNDLYIGIQAASLGVLQREEWKNPFTGACFGNLDGSPNYHQTDAIPGIVGDLIPFSSASKGLSIFKKLNAAEFSHMFKGTLSRLKPANRGIINRGINGIIENTNNYIGSGKIIVDGISASQTAIEVNKKKDGDN